MRGPSSHARPDRRLVRVFATASTPEGLLVKGLLESDGIPVFEKGEAEGPYRLGQVYLWVPDEYEVQARALIEDASTAGAEIGHDAPASLADADDMGSWPADL
jgi:hypothetical protein